MCQWIRSTLVQTTPFGAKPLSKPISSNGSIFHVSGPLCGEFTVTGEFPSLRPVTKASFDVFFDQCLNKRLRGRWFEKTSCSLWRHCNERNWNKNKDIIIQENAAGKGLFQIAVIFLDLNLLTYAYYRYQAVRLWGWIKTRTRTSANKVRSHLLCPNLVFFMTWLERILRSWVQFRVCGLSRVFHSPLAQP